MIFIYIYILLSNRLRLYERIPEKKIIAIINLFKRIYRYKPLQKRYSFFHTNKQGGKYFRINSSVLAVFYLMNICVQHKSYDDQNHTTQCKDKGIELTELYSNIITDSKKMHKHYHTLYI